MRYYRVTIIVLLVMVLTETAAFPVGRWYEPLVRNKGEAAAEVVERPTLIRKVDMDSVPLPVDGFEFLLDRPRLTVAVVSAADPQVDRYDVAVLPGGVYHVSDSRGLEGDMEVVGSQPGRRIYYISGHWALFLGVKFHGRMVILEEYSAGRGRDTAAVTKGYMKVDNPLIGAVARVVAFLFPKKVDARINRFASALRKAAQAIHDDPAGVYKTLAGSHSVTPAELEEYRLKFVPGRL